MDLAGFAALFWETLTDAALLDGVLVVAFLPAMAIKVSGSARLKALK